MSYFPGAKRRGNNDYFAAHKDDCGAQLLLQRGNSAKLLSFQLAASHSVGPQRKNMLPTHIHPQFIFSAVHLFIFNNYLVSGKDIQSHTAFGFRGPTRVVRETR